MPQEKLHIFVLILLILEILNMSYSGWTDSLDWVIVCFNNDLKEKLIHEKVRSLPFHFAGTYQVMGR